MSATGSRGSSRLAELDGLRGAAAVVVLLSHLSATIPAIGRTYLGADGAALGSPVWWVSHSPLKVFTAGIETVYIFFILSGLVVTLPALRFGLAGWCGYYARRTIRLGLPFVVAIVFGYALAFALVRANSPATSPWLTGQAVPPTVGNALQDVLLLNPFPLLNNPLWSIRIEIFFSAALPIYVLFCWLARRAPLVAGALMLIASAVLAASGRTEACYFGLFGIGASLAVLLPRLQAIRERVANTPAWPWVLLVALAGSLLIAPWLVDGTLSGAPAALQVIPTALTVVGAAALVLLAAVAPPVRSFFTSRPAQVAGKYSFSLYLVHVPVIATVAFLAGSQATVALLIIGSPLLVLATAGFSRWVEQPSHRLSQKVGKRVTRAVGALQGSLGTSRSAEPSKETTRL